MSHSKTYLKWLSSIPVSARDLLQALDQCGEPNPENGGFWGYAMTVGSLHPSNPTKANAILSRLEALFVAIPDGHRSGWSLPLSDRVTLERRDTLAAAAVIPLQRREDQMVFDRVVFVNQALRMRRDRSPTGSQGTRTICAELGTRASQNHSS